MAENLLLEISFKALKLTASYNDTINISSTVHTYSLIKLNKKSELMLMKCAKAYRDTVRR